LKYDISLSAPSSSCLDYVFKLHTNQKKIDTIVSENLDRAHNRQKSQYDKYVKINNQFQPGDLALVVNTRKRVGHSKAFEPKFYGPFRIVKAVGEVNYEITTLDGSQKEVIHFNRLKKYFARPSGVQQATLRQKEKKKRTSPDFINENVINEAIFSRLLAHRRLTKEAENSEDGLGATAGVVAPGSSAGDTDVVHVPVSIDAPTTSLVSDRVIARESGHSDSAGSEYGSPDSSIPIDGNSDKSPSATGKPAVARVNSCVSTTNILEDDDAIIMNSEDEGEGHIKAGGIERGEIEIGLSKLKNVELQAMLKERDLKISGNKATLVKRLYEAMKC
jgi:hypothetical protein